MSLLESGRPTNKQKAILDVQNLKNNTIKMNANMPRDFHKQIKQRALDEGITVTELVCRAVKAYLATDKHVIE